MRLIKVKPGTSMYKLKGDDGVVIGEVKITYTPGDHTCSIAVAKTGPTITSLSIE